MTGSCDSLKPTSMASVRFTVCLPRKMNDLGVCAALSSSVKVVSFVVRKSPGMSGV